MRMSLSPGETQVSSLSLRLDGLIAVALLLTLAFALIGYIVPAERGLPNYPPICGEPNGSDALLVRIECDGQLLVDRVEMEHEGLLRILDQRAASSTLGTVYVQVQLRTPMGYAIHVMDLVRMRNHAAKVILTSVE